MEHNFTPHGANERKNEMDKVRFGVIGIGNMGSSHSTYLHAGEIDGAVLTAVCDLKEDRLNWAKEKFEGAALFSDYKEMIASGLCDCIIVAVPHYDHPKICIDVLNAGINVICEKPIGVYTKQAEELIDAASKSDKVFGLMFNQRTNAMYRKARAMVQNGELGELKRCVWIITDWYRTQSYYTSGGWRATWKGEGGGVILNQCPHQLDLWQWIFGMPKTIRAFCHEGKYHDIEVEDDVTVYAEYENGATGTFITTTGETPGTNRLEISGDKGKLVIEGNSMKFWKNNVPERKWTYECEEGFKAPGCECIDVDYSDCKLPKEQHRGITQNVTNAILYGEKLMAPGEEGINGLRISNAIFMSSWLGKPVDLPVDGELFYEMLQDKIKNSTFKKVTKETVSNLEGTYGQK